MPTCGRTECPAEREMAGHMRASDIICDILLSIPRKLAHDVLCDIAIKYGSEISGAIRSDLNMKLEIRRKAKINE